ncbi:hypothetical protein CLU86_1590 [Acidovorax sp. 62]|nr:hypothetical protein CLU86_1590 [Acidovorax sp. 62]
MKPGKHYVGKLYRDSKPNKTYLIRALCGAIHKFGIHSCFGVLLPKFAQDKHSIRVALIHIDMHHLPPHTTYRVVNKITTGMVTSASTVDTATLAVTASCATS